MLHRDAQPLPHMPIHPGAGHVRDIKRVAIDVAGSAYRLGVRLIEAAYRPLGVKPSQ